MFSMMEVLLSVMRLLIYAICFWDYQEKYHVKSYISLHSSNIALEAMIKNPGESSQFGHAFVVLIMVLSMSFLQMIL